jgi:hypothetical protein
MKIMLKQTEYEVKQEKVLKIIYNAHNQDFFWPVWFAIQFSKFLKSSTCSKSHFNFSRLSDPKVS